MSTVVFDISLSLDGFVTAAPQTVEEPLGPGGEQLHGWLVDRDYLERAVSGLGAVVAGRTTYDHSIPSWGADGPSGVARRPVFVVTHEAPDAGAVPEGGVYTFVTDGIESAVEQAEEAAAGRTVTVMGGADLGRQCLAAGLVDEVSLHVAPVLFGSGTPMFAGLDVGHLRLELLETSATPEAVHLRYRVLRPAA
ncbi:dihydrofolate reductase family protein [Terrabacter aerolatus]|uniref:Deaminase reductase n=1 Tax=Terrabacter aerolatus TaxID=422442 RepID=A0A512D0J4_9MICO|nr:dihydrofolate reductase family protein [Terrabacter aerolatus]GEO29975.1 deaminase reductase [Terrabacter aerolatus]